MCKSTYEETENKKPPAESIARKLFQKPNLVEREKYGVPFWKSPEALKAFLRCCNLKQLNIKQYLLMKRVENALYLLTLSKKEE